MGLVSRAVGNVRVKNASGTVGMGRGAAEPARRLSAWCPCSRSGSNGADRRDWLPCSGSAPACASRPRMPSAWTSASSQSCSAYLRSARRVLARSLSPARTASRTATRSRSMRRSRDSTDSLTEQDCSNSSQLQQVPVFSCSLRRAGAPLARQAARALCRELPRPGQRIVFQEPALAWLYHGREPRRSMSVAHDWRLGPYTVDDLDDPVRFPPDEGTYEMRDGWVLMSPWHGLSHEIIVDNAKSTLRSPPARAGINARPITPRVATPDTIRNNRIPHIA